MLRGRSFHRERDRRPRRLLSTMLQHRHTRRAALAHFQGFGPFPLSLVCIKGWRHCFSSRQHVPSRLQGSVCVSVCIAMHMCCRDQNCSLLVPPPPVCIHSPRSSPSHTHHATRHHAIPHRTTPYHATARHVTPRHAPPHHQASSPRLPMPKHPRSPTFFPARQTAPTPLNTMPPLSPGRGFDFSRTGERIAEPRRYNQQTSS